MIWGNFMKKIYIIIISMLLIQLSIIFLGCAEHEASDKIVIDNFGEDMNNEFSVWLAYWDLDIENEIELLNEKIKNISYFESYFDKNNKLILNDDLMEFYEKRKNSDHKSYLTFVNDKEEYSGDILLKDTEVLNDVLGSEEARSKHIDEILDIAEEHEFDGVEIDYERIKDNIELWNEYISFINELYTKANNINKEVRIILEPNTPLEKLQFSEGPTYVMMCYNLYSNNTEPGEKANPEFIQECIDRMQSVPGEKSFAIATGGIDWQDGEQGKSINEKSAKELLQKYKVYPIRDVESKCLRFKYVDENNNNHDVWYADKETLNSWLNVINKNGYEASIWRLGGNIF